MMASDFSFVVCSARISKTFFRWSKVTPSASAPRWHQLEAVTVVLQSLAGAFIAKYALTSFVSWQP